MKNYSQFLKEEVDLKKGNKGIPEDFMKKSEDQARQNLGNVGDLGQLVGKSMQLLTNGLSTDQIEERYKMLEELAKRVIMDEYGDIIEASTKPVELMIKLVRPNKSVLEELPRLMQVPEESSEKPEYSEEEETQTQTQSEPQAQSQGQSQALPQAQSQEQEEDDDFWGAFSDDTNYEDQEEETPEAVEEIEVTNKDVAMAIDKKKILNMIAQGEGKATKDIIRYSEVVENGLSEIFGDSYRELLDVWIKISEAAHKSDWSISDKMKASMMKNTPKGLAGAVDVDWVNESTNFTKIVIKAYGIDFPMLLHECVKGIYMLLMSSAIKKDDEIAEEIKRATSSFKDESQDFKYGVPAQNMFRDFINACKDANKYTQMRARVFAQLAIDKEKGGRYTDEEFLEITNSLFSVFDSKMVDGKISFEINPERFAASKAKLEIEKVIADIVKAEDKAEEEYRKALSEWEMEQRFGTNAPEPQGDDEEHPEPGRKEAQSDIDRLVRQSFEAPEEQEDDERNLSKRDIQRLIDDALDKGKYEEVERLAKLPNYLKEGLVYLSEIKRINESKITKRK
jgi:hypothetical protein